MQYWTRALPIRLLKMSPRKQENHSIPGACFRSNENINSSELVSIFPFLEMLSEKMSDTLQNSFKVRLGSGPRESHSVRMQFRCSFCTISVSAITIQSFYIEQTILYFTIDFGIPTWRCSSTVSPVQ